jgi:hypothetical protein
MKLIGLALMAGCQPQPNVEVAHESGMPGGERPAIAMYVADAPIDATRKPDMFDRPRVDAAFDATPEVDAPPDAMPPGTSIENGVLVIEMPKADFPGWCVTRGNGKGGCFDKKICSSRGVCAFQPAIVCIHYTQRTSGSEAAVCVTDYETCASGRHYIVDSAENINVSDCFIIRQEKK